MVVFCCLAMFAATPVFAKTKRQARDCIKTKIQADGRTPSSPISLTPVGGILGWSMLANEDSFKYFVLDKNICNASLPTVQRYPMAAGAGLRFPGSCKRKTLLDYARRCGLTVDAGGSHYLIRRADGSIVTVIPRTVKSNGTCREIINALVAQCEPPKIVP